MSIPYIGFGNDTLERLPVMKVNDYIRCPTCGKRHIAKDGKPPGVALFYKCRGKTYLCAVAGRNVTGVKADVSGKL